MKRASRLFAMAALGPAAFHAGPVFGAASLLVPVCTGNGQVRLLSIQRDGGTPGQPDQREDCAKGCHTGSQRKRGGAALFEAAQ